MTSATKISGPRLDILDVGHGSCTVVSDGSASIVIDCGPGAHLLEYFRAEGVTSIDTVLLSHADSDHIRGLIALLGADIKVRRVVVNADGMKASGAWRSLTYDLENQFKRGSIVEVVPAVEGLDVAAALAGIDAVLLAPSLGFMLRGVGSSEPGVVVTSNSMSAVVRVDVDGKAIVLLTGDVDAVGFAALMASSPDLRSDYLVLPHHGGLAGTLAESIALTQDLTKAVEPLEILVSNGRGKFGNPRREIIGAARAVAGAVRISCTQLAEACCKPLPKSEQVSSLYSAGERAGKTCAGSIRLTNDDGITTARDTRAHDDFVNSFAKTAMCRMA